MSTEQVKQEGLFYSVIDGTFRRRVAEGTPGATKREYETRNGEKGIKHEMVVDSLEGYIESMGIHEGDYGRSLNIKLDPNADGVNPNLQFNVETTYGEDVLKKLPGVDFSQQVKFRPFAFTDQSNGREVRGVEIKQGETKFKNYFLDEEKNPLHGLPAFPEDTSSMTKDDWKIHFMTVRKFLISYFNEKVVPKFEGEKNNGMDLKNPNIGNTGVAYPTEPNYGSAPEYPTDELNSKDISF